VQPSPRVTATEWPIRIFALAVAFALCLGFVSAFDASRSPVAAAPAAKPRIQVVATASLRPRPERRIPHALAPPMRAAERILGGRASAPQRVERLNEAAHEPVSGTVDAGVVDATAPQSLQPLSIDIQRAMSDSQSHVLSMSVTAGAPTSIGRRTAAERFADDVSSTERRDCLGPQPNMKADLIQLAIYLQTAVAGKCKGQ
jgi:hypothetical protein